MDPATISLKDLVVISRGIRGKRSVQLESMVGGKRCIFETSFYDRLDSISVAIFEPVVGWFSPHGSIDKMDVEIFL